MDEVKPSSMGSTQEKIAKTLQKTKMKVSSAAGRTTHLVISFLSTILTLVLVFAVAVFLYATFYYAYVPVNHLKMPVIFQFEPCDSTSTASKYDKSIIQTGWWSNIFQMQFSNWRDSSWQRAETEAWTTLQHKSEAGVAWQWSEWKSWNVHDLCLPVGDGSLGISICNMEGLSVFYTWV